jgi:hypothetical protein
MRFLPSPEGRDPSILSGFWNSPLIFVPTPIASRKLCRNPQKEDFTLYNYKLWGQPLEDYTSTGIWGVAWLRSIHSGHAPKPEGGEHLV